MRKSKFEAGVLGGTSPAKPGKMECCEIILRRGHAGGFIATNRMEDKNGYGGKTHEYPLATMKHVIKHVREHLPSVEPEEAEKNPTPNTSEKDAKS